MTTFPKNARVIFTGDSITAHTKYTARVKDHYDKHHLELNVKFASGAAAGASLTHLIKFFDELIMPFKPTHATVCIGINDCGRGWLEHPDKMRDILTEKYANYRQNLNTYLDMLIWHNITPILVSIAPYAQFMKSETPALKHGQKLSFEYAEVIRDVAAKRGIELIDAHAFIAERYLYEDIYTPDRVHPGDFGHYRLAECILRHQGEEIGEYKPLDEMLDENETLRNWHKYVSRICDIYTTYVCIFPELFGKPLDEQMSFVEEYVITRGYGDSTFHRDFTTEFVVTKPKEAELWTKLAEVNGDKI